MLLRVPAISGIILPSSPTPLAVRRVLVERPLDDDGTTCVPRTSTVSPVPTAVRSGRTNPSPIPCLPGWGKDRRSSPRRPAAVVQDRLPVARARGPETAKPTMLLRSPCSFWRTSASLPTKSVLLQLDGPADARLERRRLHIELVAVQGVAHLQAQRVARAQADRRAPRSSSALQSCPRPPAGR